MIEQNNKCYSFEELNFDKSLFNSIDATYILYLEGNGRYDSIRSQLSLYVPTKKVYIVHNKGYKKCPKKYVKYSTHDCANSHLEAYIHANNMSYNNILILEDDFEFNPEIKNKNIISYLNNFILSKSNTNFIYYLGIIPIILIPYDYFSYKVIASGGTHAYIASSKYRERILSNESNKKDFIKALHFESHINSNTNAYTYNKYLCTQIFPQTENSQNWGKSDKETIFTKFMFNCVKKYNKFVKLDKQIEPGYTIGYTGTKILFWFIVLIIIYLFYLIFINKIKLN